jgi:hypothetical protein
MFARNAIFSRTAIEAPEFSGFYSREEEKQVPRHRLLDSGAGLGMTLEGEGPQSFAESAKLYATRATTKARSLPAAGRLRSAQDDNARQKQRRAAKSTTVEMRAHPGGQELEPPQRPHVSRRKRGGT